MQPDDNVFGWRNDRMMMMMMVTTMTLTKMIKMMVMNILSDGTKQFLVGETIR